MKDITFDCPACGSPLTVPESAAADTGPCPECGEDITGPGLEPEEDAGPREAPAATEETDTGRSDPREPPVARSPLQLGLGAVAALCIVSSAACLSLGYQLGRSATPSPEPPAGASDLPGIAPPPPAARGTLTPPSPPPSSPITSTAATPPHAPAPAPDAVNPENAVPGEAALLGFLSAGDWTARRNFVLHAEHVATQMEALAMSRGDGPIRTTGISALHQTEQSVVFQVSTEDQPKGFPVALSRVDDRWLIDWAGFSEFHYRLFHAFVTEDMETSGTFRVLIKPELAGLGDTGRQPYSASTSDMKKPATIYAAEDSPEFQTLEDLIGTLAARVPVSFRQLMASGGVPMILQLSKTADGDKTIIMIDRIINQGWSPQPPQTPAPETP